MAFFIGLMVPSCTWPVANLETCLVNSPGKKAINPKRPGEPSERSKSPKGALMQTAFACGRNFDFLHLDNELTAPWNPGKAFRRVQCPRCQNFCA